MLPMFKPKVKASVAGVVVSVKEGRGRARITVASEMVPGEVTYYCSRPLVSTGQSVRKGKALGVI